MMDASLALQRALYARLVGDAGVQAALGGPHVFDHVPHSRAFPYLAFGDSEARARGSADSAGAEHELTLVAHSDARGREEVLAVMAAVEAALAAPLAPEGHALVLLRPRRMQARRAADGRSYHARLTLRAITEPAG